MHILNLINELLEEINKFKKFSIFSIEEENYLKKAINEIMREYILLNIKDIIYSDFEKELFKYCFKIFYIQFSHLFLCHDDKLRLKYKLFEIIENVKSQIFTVFIPYRSYKSSFIRNTNHNKYILKKRIDILLNIPQPNQRTEEWYIFRHNLLTASSIWKIFKSQSTRNQIIYEKCKPFSMFKSPIESSPLHWGQKYEPVSIMFYEHLYKTKITDFGCIKHSKYPCIGASPDGINTDFQNDRYGRMLEIKNVVNREINGIPKMEYWIQMQIQMETCNLNECDFLETQFIEYENYDLFMKDGEYTFSEKRNLKGIIILFSDEGNFHYEYAPLYCSIDEYTEWEKQIFNKNQNMEWIKNIYWKLEKYSNVLVLRNKLWFKNVIAEIEDLWEIICIEKILGFEHRAPIKRNNIKIEEPLLIKKCFLKNIEII